MVRRKYNLPKTRLLLVREGSAPFDAPPTVNSSSEAAQVARTFIGEAPIEHMLALCCDNQNRIRTVITLAIGGSAQVALTISDVLRPVLTSGYNNFILVHNHPSGNPSPSKEDIDFTVRVRAATSVVGLRMLDHIVLGDDDSFQLV